MKKINITKITAIVLFLTMLALTIISGTYAKYTTSITKPSTATVAKWKINLTGNKTEAQEHELDLFANIADLDGLDSTYLSSAKLEENTENDVAANKIAPGTWGKIAFSIENASEVNATYEINVTNVTMTDNLPIYISLNGKDWEKLENTVTPITLKSSTAIDMNTTEEGALFWKWDYFTSDTQDKDETTIAEKTSDVTCNVTLEIKATQAN